MSHLVPLTEGWSLWRWAVLRAPGFPASDLTRLAGDEKRALRELAGSPRFQEALTWQNRSALAGSIAALLRRPGEANDSQTRRHERTAALYLQRYCVKNETIGFFGPVGWAELGAAQTELLTGPELLAERHVYFERWGIELFARTLLERLRPALRPRLLPVLRMEGRSLVSPRTGRRDELPEPFAALAAACTGERTALEIARAAVDPQAGLENEQDVLEALSQLEAKKVIAWDFDLPTSGSAWPEADLRWALAAIGDAPAQEALGELERARDAAQSAAGDAPALGRALQNLEDTFTRLTGQPARRKAGDMYAGRTLVYEDCRRGDVLRLGEEVLRELTQPLALVLQSARWFSHEVARRYREALLAWHRAQGGGTVELARLWAALPELFPGPTAGGQSIVDQVSAELGARWARLLELPQAGARVSRTVAALRTGSEVLFAAPGPGWPTARYHSPDVLLAASSVEAIRSGHFTLVLGELHLGLNTVVSPMFVKEHPDPEWLVQARERDLPKPCIAPVWSSERSRADVSSPARHDLDLEDGAVRSFRPRGQVLQLAHLRLMESGGGLVVRTADGDRSFDPIAVLEQHLIAEAHSRFAPLAPAPHRPRVTLDRLVLAREQWRVEGSSVPAEFAALRAWAGRLGLPRYVMFKVPEEIKPVYLDLESPLFADIFMRAAHRTTWVTITEMLPSPDELWLTDHLGQRYTSELRFAAVDPLGWQGSAP